jgi:ABC-type glycerol-3-phosphate transport system substrate-binding protein
MKLRISIDLLFLMGIFFAATALRADWKSDWEQTVAAARKEGRLNFYVGRYGQAALLEEFKKDYPAIQIASINGTGDQLATRIAAETRAGKTIADIYSGGPNSSYNLLYRGKILDSIKAAFILPEVLDESKWYGAKHTFAEVRDLACAPTCEGKISRLQLEMTMTTQSRQSAEGQPA